MAVVEQIAAVGDRKALLGVLLDQEDADAGLLDPRERAKQLAAQQRRQARAKARPASGSTAPTSWRGRPPPSAARRRSWCAPVACAARRACGNSVSTRSMLSASRGRARFGCAPSTRFSCTVRSANMPRSSGTSAIPVSTISCGGRWVMSTPSIVTVLPGIARRLAGDRAQEGALAGAVGAEHHDDLARRDRHRDILDRAMAAVEHREIADLKHRRLRDRRGSPRRRPAPPSACPRRS